MKRILLTALAFLAFLTEASADDARTAYIKKYAPVAVKEMKRTGVPASITLAQGLLESNAGRSMLAVEGNNHFGVKCHKGWTGKTIHKDAEIQNECFRAYSNAEASFKDHSDFLRNGKRYDFLFELKKGDYKGWANGLKKAGYATDPAYPQKLIKLIEEYDLARFDTGKVIEAKTPAAVVEEAPAKVEEPVDNTVYSEVLDVSLTREVFKKNGAEYILAREGETYESIARYYRLFKHEILKYNGLNSLKPLQEGEIVYISPKR